MFSYTIIKFSYQDYNYNKFTPLKKGKKDLKVM
jgi:hypothetical protein